MTKAGKLLQAIQTDLDPKFTVAPKSSFWLARVHSWFSPRASIILGHICYVPDEFLGNTDWMTQLLAHEGVHVAQKCDLGVFEFNMSYGYPQSVAGILFAISLGFGISWGIFGDFIYGVLAASGWMLAAIFFAVNIKIALPRAIFELEAYATSWWHGYGAASREDSSEISKAWDDWINQVHERISRSTYLWCGRSVSSFTAMVVIRETLSGRLYGMATTNRNHTVKWLETARRILLDGAEQLV